MTELVRRADLVLPGTASEVGLQLPDNLSFEDWEATGDVLRRINKACLWWWGDWCNFGERAYGEKYSQALENTDWEYNTLANAAAVSKRVEIPRRRGTLSFSHHAEVAYKLEPYEQDDWLGKAEANGWTQKELRYEIRRWQRPMPDAPPLPPGRFSTIIIDPPWEMEKISRDVRPNQGAMDYPALSIEQIEALPIPEKATDDAHIYLWTTHKHLPDALHLLDAWDFNYQCLLTWVKNVGITPFSWMYSTEHVVFGRRGNLQLAELGRRLDFSAKVREHSRKPDEFYNLVRDVSPGPRIDMFAREPHEGFSTWGNEADRFADVLV